MKLHRHTSVGRYAATIPHTRPERYSATDAVLLDSLSNGIIFIDNLCVIRCVNSKVEVLLGLCRDSVIGKRLDLLPLGTPLYRILSESSCNLPFEVNINGTAIAGKTFELRAPSGSVAGEIIELHDVTDMKRERKLREDYIAMMTHDLKSPLTAIICYAQMLKLDFFGKIETVIRNPVEKIEVSSLKLLSMIEEIMDSYRSEASGLFQVYRKHDDIKLIISECCQEKALEAEAAGKIFEFRIANDIPMFSFDKRLIPHVFTNLLGNALKYTPRSGRITLVAQMKNLILHVEVEDTGIGISRDDLKRIFTRYYRAANADCFFGTGLGLTISKAIVEAHGGNIEVESTEGIGSKFVVKIPRSYEEIQSQIAA